jgi:hypothetical protein
MISETVTKIETAVGMLIIDTFEHPDRTGPWNVTRSMLEQKRPNTRFPYVWEISLEHRPSDGFRLSVCSGPLNRWCEILPCRRDLRRHDLASLPATFFEKRLTPRRRFLGQLLMEALPPMIRAAVGFSAHERLNLLRQVREFAAQFRAADGNREPVTPGAKRSAGARRPRHDADAAGTNKGPRRTSACRKGASL